MKKKFLIGAGILFLILIAVVFLSVMINQNQPPPTLVANFMNLDQVERISKFRSCTGHTTVPQDMREMKRSMKHYVQVKPEYLENNVVELYSPYDGYVSTIRSEPQAEHPLEGEIWIRPKGGFIFAPPLGIWQFSIQHIDVRKDLKRGSEVKAGELIGWATFSKKRLNFDVVYGKMAPIPKEIDKWRSPFTDLDSIFNHMSEDVLSEYLKRGISREEIILTKEERDKNPCVYRDNGPYFENQDDLDNWIFLE